MIDIFTSEDMENILYLNFSTLLTNILGASKNFTVEKSLLMQSALNAFIDFSDSKQHSFF